MEPLHVEEEELAGAVIYALWPGNREEFTQAARTPLNDGDDNG